MLAGDKLIPIPRWQIRLPKYFTLYAFAMFSGQTLVAYAHHSDTPHFYMDQNVIYQGVVTDFKFVNPHTYVYFDMATESGGSEAWRCELPAAITLRRHGWTSESLTHGQIIRIDGSPARREERHCYLNALVLDDGSVVEREDAGPVLVAEGVARDRPLQLDNGHPNISGHWVARPRSGRREPVTQTAAALEAASAFEYEFDHPALQCESVGIIHGWPFGRFVNQIIQSDNKITILYGYLDLNRTIHLDVTEHPENMTHSVAGHSIGHWEDEVLVVDTAGISAGAVSPLRKAMHSDQYHVVERFSYDELNHTLIREYTASDSLYFEAPFSGRDVADISAITYQPYDCEELSGANNIRPGATTIGERPAE
ncbi:MAG: hypothetical protein HOJ88_11020 [Proteobacteria bacterium]|jgi:hypothetical protein|nr:hypothetical protein [Pseudomonadota bacterium]